MNRVADGEGVGDAEGWRRGVALLEERFASLPVVLAEALDVLPSTVAAAGADHGAIDAVVATGVGSSAAHARFLVSVLAELGVPARFAPLTAFLDGSAGESAHAALVVFSQGLSPNARIPLERSSDWGAAWVVTSTPEPPANPIAGERDVALEPELAERRVALAALGARGVRVLRHPGGEEYGTLLRVVGPLVGYAAALALVRVLARAARSDRPEPPWARSPHDRICARVAGARACLAAAAEDVDAAALEAGLAFLASGAHVDRVGNLPLKVLEGMLRPLPPVWDLLDFAHGAFQQLHAGPATLLALARADAPGDAKLLDRVESMLVPGRHRLVRLRAELPGPLAIFEHEALVDALVLRYLTERHVDQIDWPGKGRDAPLYRLGPATSSAAAHADAGSDTDPDARRAAAPRRDLEDLTWPEVEAAIGAGRRVAILPLGSTEQHGPHLPLATDTRIARRVAERLAARLEDAIVLPALALGCADEHLGFAGTLSLRASTLQAILCDVASSLARHGFARMFVVTAHGGNRTALEASLAEMRACAPELAIACPPSLPPAEVLQGASARFGVAPEAAGHHAGEFETSIVAQLDPASVRWDRLAPGLLDVGPDAAAIFYPSLRAHARDGTVGDPRGADAARAEAYVDAWVDWLLALYRRPESWK